MKPEHASRVSPPVEAADLTAPLSARELRFQEKVRAVVASHPNGAALAEHFGIGVTPSLLPETGSKSTDALISNLQDVSQVERDLTNVLPDLSEHVKLPSMPVEPLLRTGNDEREKE